MRLTEFHKLPFILLVMLSFLPAYSKKTDSLSSSPSVQVRCDGFYYCVRPGDENLMMVIRFFKDGKLRASQWFRRDDAIGKIADAKNAADSWLKQCEGFTVCTSYHFDGAKVGFELNFSGSEQVFASGSPAHRSFSGKSLEKDCISLTWDHDDTRFLFNFIHNDDRQPTSSDSLTE
jgi:hypothetical protein